MVLVEMLRGVEGVVEANSFEHLCLWREEHQERKVPWREGLGPYPLIKVGYCGVEPIWMSFRIDEVGGHRIMFYEATSSVVDYRKIDLWLEASLPDSARRPNGHLNKVDAMNFHNVFPPEVKAA